MTFMDSCLARKWHLLARHKLMNIPLLSLIKLLIPLQHLQLSLLCFLHLKHILLRTTICLTSPKAILSAITIPTIVEVEFHQLNLQCMQTKTPFLLLHGCLTLAQVLTRPTISTTFKIHNHTMVLTKCTLEMAKDLTTGKMLFQTPVRRGL
ncbi:uncharacterized protein LOC126588568 [Malus sylvestris]|uniref:uncharacterized protein LOC126588568 n=1 Tax=Malus sylvestris TaxID=3752 RepID=UPI0021ABE10B|nr:uncharacterized protein LOC126588568 [Malus sylvestris]